MIQKITETFFSPNLKTSVIFLPYYIITTWFFLSLRKKVCTFRGHSLAGHCQSQVSQPTEWRNLKTMTVCSYNYSLSCLTLVQGVWSLKIMIRKKTVAKCLKGLCEIECEKLGFFYFFSHLFVLSANYQSTVRPSETFSCVH